MGIDLGDIDAQLQALGVAENRLQQVLRDVVAKVPTDDEAVEAALRELGAEPRSPEASAADGAAPPTGSAVSPLPAPEGAPDGDAALDEVLELDSMELESVELDSVELEAAELTSAELGSLEGELASGED